jgi:HD superfamily phosphodiesterase
MDKKLKKIWLSAIQYLRQARKKDFVTHTKWVVKSMEMILDKERGEADILVPAAILHDVGWANVPVKLQMAVSGEAAKKALKLHLKEAVPLARKVLADNGYGKKDIEKIVGIILSHQFAKPRAADKRMLIDADTLSDIFKEPFYADAKAYNKSPAQLYEFRKNNRFYTTTARAIFVRELVKRQREIHS